MSIFLNIFLFPILGSAEKRISLTIFCVCLFMGHKLVNFLLFSILFRFHFTMYLFAYWPKLTCHVPVLLLKTTTKQQPSPIKSTNRFYCSFLYLSSACWDHKVKLSLSLVKQQKKKKHTYVIMVTEKKLMLWVIKTALHKFEYKKQTHKSRNENLIKNLSGK